MAEEVKYNNTLVSGRADETLSYTRYIKDESSGKSTKELLDEKVNKTDQLGTTQIADNAVTTEKLAEHSVVNSKLSPDSVSYDKIQNDAVITEKIQNGAVTTEKVEEKAITNPKLGDQSVDGRVVREASLESKHFANESVTTEKVARKSITKDKLADNAVDASQVVDGSIGNAKLSPDSVTTEKIKDGSVTNEKIANDTLGIEKFDQELRKTIQAATGLPEDLNQMIQDVDKSVKKLHEKDADLQSQIDDKQQQITSNDEDISLLQTRSTQMEEAIKGISASGGASQATAVTYENTESGLDSITAQGAIDELQSKKFNKENIAQEFGESENKVVSQFALPFREIESPEFIKVIVDAEDHFLLGIQLDGSIEWGKGIPAPIRAKLQEIISKCQQDKTDLTEAINNAKEELTSSLQAYQQTTDASIAALQEGKVDKEEGKSLIEDEVKECFRVIENEEFIKAVVDSEDKVLFGFRRDTGKPYYPLNEMYHVIQNEEFFAAWITTDDKVVLGIRRDGEIIGEIHAVNALKQVISKLQSDVAALQEKVGIIDTDLKKLLDVFSFQDNEEYLAVEQDTEGKVLSATNPDGSHYLYNVKSETINNKVDKEEGKSLINSEFADALTAIEDSEERTAINTDALGKVVSYRDKEGFLNEEVGIKTKELSISEVGLKKLANALKGKGGDVIDWSNNSFIQLPEPRLAVINISGIDEMPWSKTQNLHAWMEFWDMQGNYFKKKVIVNAQGDSSLAFVKKNLAIDICDDDWIGDDTTKVKFGIWVSQDSFHMKAYYTDFFRGVGAVSYKLYDEIVKTRGNMYDRPWKKALLDMNHVGVTTKSFDNNNAGDFSLLTDTGARCFPDGFPIALYHNGNFYGIFSFQLKKHRDNFHLEKSKPTNIHLDGILNTSTIFSGANSIDWSLFEVRNPKSLYSIGGNKYDADIRQEELAGNAEIDVWIANKKLPDGTAISSKIKKNLQITAKVKEYIQSFADIIPSLKSMAEIYESSQKTEEDLNTLKSSFEKRFDVENLIDYIIILDITGNGDGTNKNWQWFTYDGIKWWVGLYDCDGAFGGDFRGCFIYKPKNLHQGDSMSLPTGYILKYYKDELETRYKELVNLGIISANHIFSLLKDWTMRIGTEYIKEEYNKWSDSPCISNSIVRTDYWNIVLNTQGEPDMNISGITEFDKEKSYSVGDIVYFGINSDMGLYKFKCIKPTEPTDTEDNLKISKFSPIKQYKHCDSIYRAQKWIEQNIKNMNLLYNLK